MAAIEKKQPTPQDNLRMGIRVLVVIYLAYIIYQLIIGYLSGASTMSLPILALVVLFFAAAIVVILAVSFRQWRRGTRQGTPDEPAGEDRHDGA